MFVCHQYVPPKIATVMVISSRTTPALLSRCLIRQSSRRAFRTFDNLDEGEVDATDALVARTAIDKRAVGATSRGGVAIPEHPDTPCRG